MNPVIVIGVLSGLVFLLLVSGTSFKPFQFLGQGVIKILIGALFLFFLNAFGGQVGLHVPINLVTASIAGLLGIPGVAGLAVIQMVILV
ncbi:pro-sigma K processing regulatory protein [Bacillus coahuilensis m2-6]|uniref:Pro-sigma K processing regulatory protein n=1 Tax=Bacillus coahuilensis p1.1.43 TaxID=1150625 RepID=A0A147K3M8_9BACI|nr:pro-sigmaK processing inhibitor BofA family protein [Bacillus coahuilensis]KUP03890.1 pro-sigma K processing regulatory protein [Bacillus coahuilensis p1.1.43]KUP04118.1 pro-sigma K processing regulatory protein [Bacillus coahuilensis m2-6]